MASLLNEEAALLDAARKADEGSGRSGHPVEDVVMFLVAGGLLLAVNYVLVGNSLRHDEVAVTVRAPDPIASPFGPEPLVVEGEPASVEDLQRRVRDATLNALLLQSGQALVLMAVASLGLGWLIAGRVLKLVQHMTTAARRRSEQNLHERLALQGPDDELKELGDTFDAMLARLEAAFASQRRFVADASHELRTPLSIIRAQTTWPWPTPTLRRPTCEPWRRRCGTPPSAPSG